MEKYSCLAHAKINLGLEVLYRRPDNFHEINTVFLPLSLADELECSPDKNMSLVCTPDLGISQEENLVYRAALLLKEHYQISEAAKIQVNKHIPSGAGLGGGSSDAAATLLALCRLWNIPEEKKILHELAGQLGSDVPFFLGNSAAAATGRGEILEYFELDFPFYVLVVYPEIHVSTPWAYKELGRSEEKKEGTNFRQLLEECRERPEVLQSVMLNDFEEVIFQRHPEIKKIKLELYECGAVFALMSGSGSSVFGLFTSREQAGSAADTFRDYRTFVCRQANSF